MFQPDPRRVPVGRRDSCGSKCRPGVRWFWEALRGWSSDNVPRLGAALAYYTLLALAPILLIAIAVAGMVFDRESVREQVVHQMQSLIGERGAR